MGGSLSDTASDRTPRRIEVPPALRLAVFRRDGFRCRYCGDHGGGVVLKVDHVLPRVEGGTNDPQNLVTACNDCNSGKGTQLLAPGEAPKGGSILTGREIDDLMMGVVENINAIRWDLDLAIDYEVIQEALPEIGYAELWKAIEAATVLLGLTSKVFGASLTDAIQKARERVRHGRVSGVA